MRLHIKVAEDIWILFKIYCPKAGVLIVFSRFFLLSFVPMTSFPDKFEAPDRSRVTNLAHFCHLVISPASSSCTSFV